MPVPTGYTKLMSSVYPTPLNSPVVSEKEFLAEDISMASPTLAQLFFPLDQMKKDLWMMKTTVLRCQNLFQ
jgi:hypothetical protein